MQALLAGLCYSCCLETEAHAHPVPPRPEFHRGSVRSRSPHTQESPGRGRGQHECHLTRCPANSAAPSSPALREREKRVGEAFLGLHQRACIFFFFSERCFQVLGCVLLWQKMERLRCVLKTCRRIPVSALLAAVGILIAFLSTLGCFVRAPGTAVYCPWLSSQIVWSLRQILANRLGFATRCLLQYLSGDVFVANLIIWI